MQLRVSLLGTGGACSHIAAVLYRLLHAMDARMKDLPVDLSRTSQPMHLHQPSKKVVSTAPLKDLSFVKAAYGKRVSEQPVRCQKRRFDPRPPEDRQLTQDALEALLQGVRKVFPESGLLQFWEDKPSTTSANMPEHDSHTLLEDFILVRQGNHTKTAGLQPDEMTSEEIDELFR